MDTFKLEYFSKEFPNKEFPIVGHLSIEEANAFLHRLKSKLYLPDEVSSVDVVDELEKRSVHLINIEDPTKFKLSNIVLPYGILTKLVYIVWSSFKDIDMFSIETIDEYFDYLWYKGPDDLLLFDESLKWVVRVWHDGYVNLTQF